MNFKKKSKLLLVNEVKIKDSCVSYDNPKNFLKIRLISLHCKRNIADMRFLYKLIRNELDCPERNSFGVQGRIQEINPNVLYRV
jgi:hypothetical protein